MTRNSIRPLCVCVSLAASAAIAQANIVTNGGFESIAVPPIGWYAVPNGSTDITGWTVGTDGFGGSGVGIVHGPSLGVSTADGVQAASLGFPSTGGRITQILTTVPAQTYSLTFSTSTNGGLLTSGIFVYWGGVLVADSGALGNTWTTYTLTVVASGTSTTLSFENGLPYNGLTVGFVDAVDVSPVPTPGAACLLAVSAAAGASRRRR